MARLVRKQIYIEDSQNQRLKSRARARRVSETNIIRVGIDLALAGLTTTKPDIQAWQRQKEFIHKRMEQPAEPASERWAREDLYEERLPR